MQPVALQANKELYSAEYEEIAKILEEQVANGRLTAAEAQSIANKSFGMYMNPYGTMTTGSPLEKYIAIQAYQSGNINKPSYYTNGYLNTSADFLSWGAGDTLAENIISNYLIGDATLYRRYNRNADKGKKTRTNTASEQLALFQQQIGLADNYNTNTQKVDTAILNATTDIAKIKSIITDKGWEIGKVIVGGITTWLGAKLIGGVIGKGIGALSGLSGASTASSAGLFATLGPYGAIAAGIAGLAVIANKIADKKFNNAENYGSSYNNLYNQSIASQRESGVKESEIDTVQAMVDASKGLGTADDKDWFGQSNRTYSVANGKVVEGIPLEVGKSPLSQNNMLEIFDWASR